MFAPAKKQPNNNKRPSLISLGEFFNLEIYAAVTFMRRASSAQANNERADKSISLFSLASAFRKQFIPAMRKDRAISLSKIFH